MTDKQHEVMNLLIVMAILILVISGTGSRLAKAIMTPDNAQLFATVPDWWPWGHKSAAAPDPNALKNSLTGTDTSTSNPGALVK